LNVLLFFADIFKQHLSFSLLVLEDRLLVVDFFGLLNQGPCWLFWLVDREFFEIRTAKAGFNQFVPFIKATLLKTSFLLIQASYPPHLHHGSDNHERQGEAPACRYLAMGATLQTPFGVRQ
jgi:hypothetical protein